MTDGQLSRVPISRDQKLAKRGEIELGPVNVLIERGVGIEERIVFAVDVENITLKGVTSSHRKLLLFAAFELAPFA